MDYQQLVESAQSGFEKVVGSIPGYKGYKQKELRREADKLLRKKIGAELDKQRRRLNGQQTALFKAGLIEYTDDLDQAIMKLQTLSDRVKTASYGYRGFFDAVKVKEEQLDALYAFDAGLLAGIPKIAQAIDGVAEAIQSKAEVGAAIQALVEAATELGELFSKREEAIYEAGQAGME